MSPQQDSDKEQSGRRNPSAKQKRQQLISELRGQPPQSSGHHRDRGTPSKHKKDRSSRSAALLSDEKRPAFTFSDHSQSSSSWRERKDQPHDEELAENGYTLEEAADNEIYYVKQRRGYCSIGFSVVQTGVLVAMMWQCGVAPLNINPMVGPYPDALDYWGAKNSVLIVEDGEWWRLITPIFLHAGVIHLLCNVGVQLDTSAFWEREWGSARWLVIYLTSAIGSSCLSVLFMPGNISVGSSGSVCGLFGGKLAEIILRACEEKRTAQQRIAHQVRKEQLSHVLCSVVLIGAFSFIPYVDWAAHLGGFLGGLVVGIMIFAFSVDNVCVKMVWFAVGAALTIAFYALSLQKMYTDTEAPEMMRDVCGYYKQFFDDYECNCQLPDKN